MQRHPEPSYHQNLVDKVIAYLQSGNPHIFPFAERFDEARKAAFMNDLRIGLSDLTESGSKRGTASVGRPMSDRRLREIVEDWGRAGGDWPETQNPANADGFGSVGPA